jgi:hypothetical protein
LGPALQEEQLCRKSALQLVATCTAALLGSQQSCQNLKRLHVVTDEQHPLAPSKRGYPAFHVRFIWLDCLPGTVYAPIVSILAKVSHTP